MDLILGGLLIALIVMAIVIPSVGLWALGGEPLSRFIRSPYAHRAVNLGLAIVLVAMGVLIWL
jgi:threonine/homoserine/homoserine lactone efflux protein